MTQQSTATPAGQPQPQHDLAHQLNALLASSGDLANKTTALADALLRDAMRERVSDIHLAPLGESIRVRFRIDGELLNAMLIPAAVGDRLINHFRAIADLDTGHLFKPHESRISLEVDEHELDVRLSVAPCLGGEVMVLRLLYPETILQDIHEIGLSDYDLDRLKHWMNTATGMLVVAGATGSGKTTTVYSLLHEFRHRNRSVFTLEDPIEYDIPGITQIAVDAEHGLTFSSGVRSLLRMDPDFVMLGEMREARTAHAAADAALRGRIVLSTLHARDAAGVITTLRNWMLKDYEIGAGLTAIVSQRLIRTLCTECRHEQPLTEDQQRWCRAAGIDPIPQTAWTAGHCEKCRGLGYRGRTGLFETWLLDDEDYEMITQGYNERAIYANLRQKNHRTMFDDGLEKASRGVIALEELRATPELVPRLTEGALTEEAGASSA